MKNDYRIIIVMIVALIAVIALQKTILNPASKNHKYMLKTIDNINQSCPMVINDETRLDSIALKSDSTEIVYYNTLLSIINDTMDIVNFEEILKPLIIENIKSNLNLRIFRVNNMVITNNFMDKNGEFICEISVTPEIYKSNETNGELEVILE